MEFSTKEQEVVDELCEMALKECKDRCEEVRMCLFTLDDMRI